MSPVFVEPTEQRVENATAEQVNAQIDRQIEANVLHYAQRLDQIEQRLNELDQEWDIERTLEANAGTLAAAGFVLGLLSRKFRVLPLVIGGFLVQHAIQGWCPPIPLFRRMGIRTTREINQERYALKALRGDFQQVGSDGQDAIAKAHSAMKAAQT